MGGKLPYSYCFVGCCFQDLLKIACRIHVIPIRHFVRVVQPYNSTDTDTAWENSHFILSERLNFHMVVNQSIAVHALPKHTLTSLSEDELLVMRYMNWSINFRGLPSKDAKTDYCWQELYLSVEDKCRQAMGIHNNFLFNNFKAFLYKTLFP